MVDGPALLSEEGEDEDEDEDENLWCAMQPAAINMTSGRDYVCCDPVRGWRTALASLFR